MTKAITKQEAKTVSTNVKPPRGFDNIEADDIIIPRWRLLQSLSQAVTDGDGKPGQFQNSLTEEVMDGPIEFVPLSMKNGAVYFELGKGLMCKSTDGITSVGGDKCSQCPFSEYYKNFKDGLPPKCSATKEFVVLNKPSLSSGMPEMMIVSFMKSSYPIGKRLISLARLTGKDIFAYSYKLDSNKVQNEKGTFYVMDLKKGSELNADEFSEAEKWFDIIGTQAYSASSDLEDEIKTSNPVSDQPLQEI